MTYQMTNEEWVGRGMQDAFKGFFLGGCNCLLGLLFCMVVSSTVHIFSQTLHAYYGAISISLLFGYSCLFRLEIKRFEQFLGGYAWSFMFILFFFIKWPHFMFIAVCSALAALTGYGVFLALSWLVKKIGELFMPRRG